LEKIKAVTSLSSRCFAGCSKLKEVVFVGDYKYIQPDSLPDNGLHGVCYFEKFDINNKNNCIDNGWNYVFDVDRIIPYDDVDNGCELHIITNSLPQGTYTILKSIDAYDGAYRGEMTMAMKEINCNFQASFVSHSGLEVVVPQVFDENGYPVNSPIELTIKFHTKYVHPVYRWFYDQSDKRKKVLFPSLDINENNIQYNSIVFSDETKFICTKELFNNLDIANINFNTSQQYLLNANRMFSGVEGKFPIIDTINNCDCDYMYAYTNLENVTGLKYTNCSVLGMFSGCHLLNKLDIDITGSIEYYGSGYWVEMTFIENCVVLNELSQLDVQRFHVKSFDLRSNVALEHFGGLKGATENIDISTCVLLTRDSLVNIINSLGTPGSVRYLYLNEAHFAKLTDEDLAIASRKGWIITA
jgi:hypothetical protein